MPDVQWVPIIAALAGGGAMGAIITALATTYRNRIQPMSYRIYYDKLFHNSLGDSKLKVELKISHGLDVRYFQSLYVVRIYLTNTGNTNMADFSFGLTLEGDDVAVHAEAITPDRHHIFTQTTPQIALGSAAKELDFICRPFNKRDTYVVKLFIAIASSESGVGEIQFSSPLPVKFVNLMVRENMALSILKYLNNNLTIGDVFREIDKEAHERNRKI